MDDPGWGDYVPLSPDDEAGTPKDQPTQPLGGPPPVGGAATSGSTPPPTYQPHPSTPRSRPAFLASLTGERRTTAMVVGGIVVVAVVAGILVGVLSGGNNKGTPKGTTSPGQSTGTLSLSAWASKADAICTSYLSQVDAEASDPNAEATLVDKQITAIRALGNPSTEASQVQDYLTTTSQVATDFRNDDPSSEQADAATSETEAAALGLTVCN
jgi:hypothetical protein